MPVSPLPRRTVAGTTAALALALAGTGAALALTATPAGATPGDHGDIRIHKPGTPFTDGRDESTVCGFHLAAVGFDTAQGATWAIERQPADSDGTGLDGTITLRSGSGHTLPLSLPDGDYKLTWRISGGSGVGKYKTFAVNCAPESAGASSAPGTPDPTDAASPDASAAPSPAEGAPAGEPPDDPEGSAAVADVSAMGTVTAVGLVAVSTAVYFRLLRRRSHEPA